MEILKNTFFLYRRCFLQLIAIYLVGWMVRYGIVQLAVAVAVKHGMIWGDFILPLSPLTMLLTYLGMFWVLRPYIFPDTADTGVEEFLKTALEILLPAFAIFVLWKLQMRDAWNFDHQAVLQIAEEHLAGSYTRSNEVNAREMATVGQLTNPSTSVLTLIVVSLLAVRRILIAVANRLPKWTIFPRLYVESAWIYIFFIASAAAIYGSPRWMNERKVVVWYHEQKQAVLEHLGPVADVIRWVAEHTAGATQAILAPLSWFVIAGLAYAQTNTSTWGNASRAILGQRHFDRLAGITRKPVATVQSQWQKLPAVVRSRTDEIRSTVLGTFDHIRDALRLALQTGPLPVALYIVMFATLVLLYPTDTFFDATISDGYLWRGLAYLFGPHEYAWWTSREATIRLFIGAAIEPIRICLIAGMYWFCARIADQVILNRTMDSFSSDSLNSTSAPIK
ncbi:hypothetical protein FZI91_03395 [Mycobacterium sp. CBMA271]|uniref:hypothetical protein n=1 Tax=unclassified Mycobacteroides TaxID=2618759 RepID=UPI0012DBFAAD|nr:MULTISPECIES: hypothetical protein [unclassified Mycobacteroides]MUM18165.1 hypothetical protein [Mycobacteroides sp. CBMA 326]MUM20751.1 hypothetical protein [Mycobacteroides sp. CBMA 271]